MDIFEVNMLEDKNTPPDASFVIIFVKSTKKH